MRSLQTYLEILKKKGFYVCFQELRKAVQPIWITRQRGAIERIMQERSYRYLLRHYSQVAAEPLRENSDLPQHEQTTISKHIWICWLQGEDQMPDIVKKCYNSVKTFAPDYTVHLITNVNLFEYVSLPEHIVSKYRKGIISFTHFSDILRTCLLYEHGGLWLDSTVLLTGPLPTYVTSEPIFVYRPSWLQDTRSALSSWLIAAIPHHPLTAKPRQLLFEYWKRENKLRDYYLYHLLFRIATEKNSACRQAYMQMPYICNAAPHTMQYRIFEPYTDTLWQQITRQSSIHKLSWKFKDEQKNIPDTIYQHVLSL
ncbi:MAG: capsular polysaccharide synthesis protein [Paludibacteraceae bacterium]|nr:capsular polysaccharide synthesis protein [Paludibacteraceae bacterium]